VATFSALHSPLSDISVTSKRGASVPCGVAVCETQLTVSGGAGCRSWREEASL